MCKNCKDCKKCENAEMSSMPWALIALMAMTFPLGHSGPKTIINVYTEKPEVKIV